MRCETDPSIGTGGHSNGSTSTHTQQPRAEVPVPRPLPTQEQGTRWRLHMHLIGPTNCKTHIGGATWPPRHKIIPHSIVGTYNTIPRLPHKLANHKTHCAGALRNIPLHNKVKPNHPTKHHPTTTPGTIYATTHSQHNLTPTPKNTTATTLPPPG